MDRGMSTERKAKPYIQRARRTDAEDAERIESLREPLRRMDREMSTERKGKTLHRRGRGELPLRTLSGLSHYGRPLGRMDRWMGSRARQNLTSQRARRTAGEERERIAAI